MTVAELIEALKAMPQDAIALTPNADVMGYTDADPPKVVSVFVGNDRAISPYVPADVAGAWEREGAAFDAVLIG